MVHALELVSELADAVLVGRLEQLVRSDRALSAKLLVHLGEVKARGLFRERGFSTMFEYCRSGLGMSDAEAGLRILVAGVGRRFPLVVERLGAGAVHLTAIKLLAPHLTADNHVQLLDRARGMTKREVEVLVADLAPKPDVPARMRKLPERRIVVEANAAAKVAALGSAACTSAESNTAAIAALGGVACTPAEANTATTAALGGVACTPAESTPATVVASLGVALASASGSETVLAPIAGSAAQLKAAEPRAQLSSFVLQSPRPRASSTPLGRGRFGLQVTLGLEAHVALEQLVELLRHQNPRGELSCIVERALCELLKREMKRRFGHTNVTVKHAAREPASGKLAQQSGASELAPAAEVEDRAKREVISSKSRYIPRSVLREVYARDEGQCTFVGPEGRRCCERGFMEVHHHNTTFARGGEANAENLRLSCRAHNMLLAELDYGRGFMEGKLREAGVRNGKLRAPVPASELA